MDEFLLAAGYVRPACSRSSSGSQDGKVPARDKAAKVIRSNAEVAKRYAYSELDQLARKKIAETDWMWVRSREDCDNILTAYQVYARESIYADICLSLSAVVTEVRLTVQFFAQKKLWPRWLVHPKDKELKNMPETDDAYADPGNEVWELLVNLMGLSSAMESLGHQQRFNAAPHAPYGDRTNKSAVGNYNFRGNVLERLLVTLQEGMQKERTEVPAKRQR